MRTFPSPLSQQSTATSQQGFTLVELLAVVVITAVISVVAVGVFLNSQVRGNKTRSVSQTTQQGSFLIDQINFMVRNARALRPNAAGESCAGAMESLVLETRQNTLIVLALAGDRLASDSTPLSSEDVQVDQLVFNCQQVPGQTGALIEYSFHITSGDPTTSSSFDQTFTSQVSLRSY